MTVHTPVDAERLVIAWALDTDPLAALVTDRIYSAVPANPVFPLVRITRVAGAPVSSNPLWLDTALLQVDVWGGPKATAQDIAQAVRGHMADSLQGSHALGCVTRIEFGDFQYLPDASYDPAKPRYSFDVAVYLHP